MTSDWSEVNLSRGEVVVVEDDPLIRTLIVEILEGIRGQIVTFPTADDALAHLLESDGTCSLLITDHGLPGKIRGTTLAEMLRTKWPDIPVIITSGYELDPSSLPAGVAYLQKPWSTDRLITTVVDALQQGTPAEG